MNLKFIAAYNWGQTVKVYRLMVNISLACDLIFESKERIIERMWYWKILYVQKSGGNSRPVWNAACRLQNGSIYFEQNEMG